MFSLLLLFLASCSSQCASTNTLVWKSTSRGAPHGRAAEMATISDSYELHDFSAMEPSRERLTLSVLGKQVELTLRPYDELFGNGYGFETWDDFGNKKVEGKLDCIFRATSATHNGFVSFCDSGHARHLRGQLFDDALDSIVIAPLRDHRERALVAVYEHSSTIENVMAAKPLNRPAFDLTKWNPDTKAVSSSLLMDSGLTEFNGNMASIDTFVDSKTKSVGCVIVLNNAMYNRWGALSVHARTAATFAAVASYYAELSQPIYGSTYFLNFQLTKVIAFGVRDPFNMTKDSSGRISGLTLMDNFGLWLQSSGVQHDMAHLISGDGFVPSENAAGWAWVSTACDRQGRYANGVTDGTYSDASIARILSHESGHCIGSMHDDIFVPALNASCVLSAGIMGRRQLSQAKSHSHRNLLTWSLCTVKWFEIFFTTTYNGFWNPACMETPDLAFDDAVAVCGDGIVEGDENCDDPSGTDHCCTSTCTFAVGAICSALDGCCDANTCNFKAATTVCRAVQNSCDMAETCSGVTAFCPTDVTQPVGTPYTENGITGTCGCNAALAPSNQQQCLNWNIIYNDYCAWVESPNTCGELWCTSTEDPYCWTSGARILTGTKCGTGMGCYNSACVPFDQIVCAQASRGPTKAPTTGSPVVNTNPSNQPSALPTTSKPSALPTTSKPSAFPTTSKPSAFPTTLAPTGIPTRFPTKAPSGAPTKAPSIAPTLVPSTPSSFPSVIPTGVPSSQAPTSAPSLMPSVAPTNAPLMSTSVAPTSAPLSSPSVSPSQAPVDSLPTKLQTMRPSRRPTRTPSKQPSRRPSPAPTTKRPSQMPTRKPTKFPTKRPTLKATMSPSFKSAVAGG